MQNALLELVERSSMKEKVPEFEIGDTVDVHVRILEGDKERIQIFNGVVIARSGSGSKATFTVRRIVAGEGVERTFPVHSPRIADIKVKRSGKVRRAKLYYLRDRKGKAVRLKERIKGKATETEAKEARQAKRDARKARKAAKAEAKARKAAGQPEVDEAAEAAAAAEAENAEAIAAAENEATEAQVAESEGTTPDANADAPTNDTPATETPDAADTEKKKEEGE